MKINKFVGQYSFLSNFYPSNIEYDGVCWPTAEHLYQAAKTFDKREKETIRCHLSPKKAKRAGRKVTLRQNWEQINFFAMLKVIRLKFSQNRSIAKKLIETGSTTLIEGNYWHDNTWGNCTCSKCQNVIGENRLGVILMKVRGELDES